MTKLKVGDFVRTCKGAAFCGQVVSVYDSLNGTPHCVVEATEKGFERTQHLYPTIQLESSNVIFITKEAR